MKNKKLGGYIAIGGGSIGLIMEIAASIIDGKILWAPIFICFVAIMLGISALNSKSPTSKK